MIVKPTLVHPSPFGILERLFKKGPVPFLSGCGWRLGCQVGVIWGVLVVLNKLFFGRPQLFQLRFFRLSSQQPQGSKLQWASRITRPLLLVRPLLRMMMVVEQERLRPQHA